MEKEGRAELERSLKSQRVAQVRAREAAMVEFEKVIPSDPRTLVAARLRKFLDLSKDVELLGQAGRAGQEDAVSQTRRLKASPRDWKMCFRAGKAATDTARAFAQKWLSDLEAKGVK